MRNFLSLVLLCGLCGAGSCVRAQDAPDEKPKPIFPQLFPNPTGNNGYEELMQAGDLARDNKAFNDAQQADTLTAKRRALEDPDIRYALRLIDAAFSKPLRSPRDRAKMTFDNAIFSDLAIFRNLARLLAIVEYVALADGNNNGAMDALESCLRLSRSIPAESVISALVFVAVDAIAVKQIAAHVKQFSLRESERLQLICDNCLRSTDSFASALASERDITLRQFKTVAQTDYLLDEILPNNRLNGANDPEPPEETALKNRLRDNPEDARRIFQQAQESIKTFYDALIVETKKDVWERKIPNAPKAEPAVKAITDAILPMMAQVLNKQDQGRANLRLLGTFAALQHYRWIHRRYPDSLKDLREPILTQDSFTGELLLYKRNGDAYDLHSAGPLGADGKTRTPLYLPYRKN